MPPDLGQPVALMTEVRALRSDRDMYAKHAHQIGRILDRAVTAEAALARLRTIVDEACGLQPADTTTEDLLTMVERSEERRVGKECRL